jgi:hypothetical protein
VARYAVFRREFRPPLRRKWFGVPEVGPTGLRWVATGAATANATSVQTVLPTHQQGDLLLLDLCHTAANTTTITTDLAALGWTALSTSPAQADFGQIFSYYKAAGASESAPSVTFSASGRIVAHIHALREADTTSPVDQAAEDSETAEDTTAMAAPSVTVADGTLLCVTYAARTPTNPGADVTTDADYTEHVETKSEAAAVSCMTMVFATRGPVAAGTFSGDTWAPSVNAKDIIVVRSIKAAEAAPAIPPILVMAPPRPA